MTVRNSNKMIQKRKINKKEKGNFEKAKQIQPVSDKSIFPVRRGPYEVGNADHKILICIFQIHRFIVICPGRGKRSLRLKVAAAILIVISGRKTVKEKN